VEILDCYLNGKFWKKCRAGISEFKWGIRTIAVQPWVNESDLTLLKAPKDCKSMCMKSVCFMFDRKTNTFRCEDPEIEVAENNELVWRTS